jgi:hypothetical protein
VPVNKYDGNTLGDLLLDFILHGEDLVPHALLRANSEEFSEAVIHLLINIQYRVNELPLGPGSFFERCERAVAKLRANEQAGERTTGENDPVRPSEFLALIALNAASLESRLMPSGDLVKDRFDLAMYDLVPHAARAILTIYDPAVIIEAPGVQDSIRREQPLDTSIQQRRAQRAWAELDPETFQYWRMGTTSLIIKCSKLAVESAPYTEELILKCVVFPWNLVPAIAKGTLSYADRYKGLDAVVVRALASSSRWVLMPYQFGSTLAEYYAVQNFDERTSFKQIAFAREIVLKLAVALDALSGGVPLRRISSTHQHLDLSPSNIIMAPGIASGEGPSVKFIDLGQNYLYTRQIGMADHDDAAYVAPEVKNRGHKPSSDLFSLAIITIEMLSGIKARDGLVPDAVYEISPAIGRLLDDMLDDDADKRLLLVSHDGGINFSDVTGHLQETFDLVEHEPVASDSAVERRWAQWAPASHEVASLVVTLWALRNQEGRKQLRDQVRYLAFMSLISSAVWWYIFTRCALFHFDAFVTGDWPALPHGQFLYASVIGFSQGMIASKFYQTILSRLTLLNVGFPMSLTTEFAMRLMTVVALPTTLLAVSWRPSLWAWTCALGAGLVAATNLLMLRMAVRLSFSGRHQFSTVPRLGRQVPGGFEQWWWTMLTYAFVIVIIAVGLQTGWMRDAPAYVIGLLVINFAIHYASKCVIAGSAVRGGLARAFATGERLSALERRGRS